MINASSEFRELVNKGTKLVNYADITLRDGTVLNLTPSDFPLGGFSMKDETGSNFGIGNVIGKTISMTIANHTNKFSRYDFFKSIVHAYIAIETADGRILKEKKGKYYVINPVSPGDVIYLSGVDSMYLLDRPYTANTVYPATLQQILSDCCRDCGVNIGFKQFHNYNFVAETRPKDVTYRDVASYVAQIAGANARISNNDAMELVWYDSAISEYILIDGGNYFNYGLTDVYDGGNFKDYSSGVDLDGGLFTDAIPEYVTKIKSLTVSTDDVLITGVKVEYDKVSVISGTEDYVIEVKNNPLLSGKEDAVATDLGNRLIGIRFRPLSCQIANNPLFEPFDGCIVYDRKGNAYTTLINSVNYSVNGFTTIACKAEDPIRNESSYTSEAAKAVVAERRNTERELSNYDKAVQNMNELAANAMGVFRETEELSDKSVVYYMSNRPITKDDSGKCSFTKNAVVYKMTGDGFFVSNDGGISYTSGFDSNGNAVLNVLSAIGITFDWAKGGTLTLGGENNINGVLSVLDEKGDVVGKWDKDGITLPPQTTIKWTQVIGNENVANMSDIPTDTRDLTNGAGYTTEIGVNRIITNTVTASFVNALKVTAGSVAAENITGTTISGKTISGGSIKIGSNFSVDSYGNVVANSLKSNGIDITGGSIKIGSNFSVDSYGNVVANSLKSNDATITGGSINISTSSSDYSSIVLRSGTFTNSMSASGIYLSGHTGRASLTSSVLSVNNISSDSNEIGFMKSARFHERVVLEIGKTHYVKGSLECMGSVKFTGFSSIFEVQGNVILGGSSKMLGFFGNNGNIKRSVSTIYSTYNATASSNASKINEIINALKSYNLI